MFSLVYQLTPASLILLHKLPSNLLNHLKELRFTLSTATLFIFLLEQIDVITEVIYRYLHNRSNSPS